MLEGCLHSFGVDSLARAATREQHQKSKHEVDLDNCVCLQDDAVVDVNWRANDALRNKNKTHFVLKKRAEASIFVHPSMTTFGLYDAGSDCVFDDVVIADCKRTVVVVIVVVSQANTN